MSKPDPQNPLEGIHPPHLAPDVPSPRLVREMERERRPVPPPPVGVSDTDLIDAHTVPAGPLGGLFDQEARDNDDPHNPYIRHGSLLVPRNKEALFEKAERYLSKDAEAMGVLYKLEHDSNDHVMRIGDDVASEESHGDISWNPHLATRDDAGHTISPAVALLHEEDHAIENRDVKEELKHAPAGEVWTNLEEERVITGVENRASRILHEGVRTSHDSPTHGGTYWVDSPTTRVPSENQARPVPDNRDDFVPGNEVSIAPQTKRTSRGR